MSKELQNSDILERAIEAIILLRRFGVRVHCLTNTVAQNFTANLLLACGATPSMTVAPNEIVFFTAKADSVLLNLGTLDDDRKSAMLLAAELCEKKMKPFVLDPVLCNISDPRLSFAKELIAYGPAILRANVAEKEALFHDAQIPNICLAVTGVVDEVHTKDLLIKIANGHPWLSKVTATGCAQGALMAALMPSAQSLAKDRHEAGLIAAVAALLWLGISGEIAATKSDGPGSFQPTLLDTLHSISPDTLKRQAKLT